MTKLEPALGTACAVAAFFDGDFNNFGDESLGKSTNFRMNSHRRRERTSASCDHNPVTILLHFGCSADRLKNLHRSLHPIFQARILSCRRIRSERAPDFTKTRRCMRVVR